MIVLCTFLKLWNHAKQCFFSNYPENMTSACVMYSTELLWYSCLNKVYTNIFLKILVNFDASGFPSLATLFW